MNLQEAKDFIDAMSVNLPQMGMVNGEFAQGLKPCVDPITAKQALDFLQEKHLAVLIAEFERGIQEGESKQAIIELRGRDKFLDEVRGKQKAALAEKDKEINKERELTDKAWREYAKRDKELQEMLAEQRRRMGAEYDELDTELKRVREIAAKEIERLKADIKTICDFVPEGWEMPLGWREIAWRAKNYDQQVLENIDLLTRGQQDMPPEYNKIVDAMFEEGDGSQQTEALK